jgi:hypothetical protein
MSNWLYDPPDSWVYSQAAYQECVAAFLELEWRRCKQDPNYFIKEYVRTKDQLDQTNPFKPFPDLLYLWALTDLYLTERVVVVAKSRRTIVTWHACAFQLWDCLLYNGRTIGNQNEKEEKAREMISMTELMYDSLPSWMKARSPMRKNKDRLEFTTRRSEIIALPQGPDVTRMYTFSRIVSDETGTQKYCPENYKGAVQTITGRNMELGGQLIYIGTAKDSWFGLLVHDQLEEELTPAPVWRRQLIPEADPHDPKILHWGMEVVRQKTTNYITVFLHYTADPDKRSAAWIAFARMGIPTQDWAQEMDIDFKAKSGKKALDVFDKYRDRIVVPHFRPPAWWPRWTSHDYGLKNPYSCHAYAMAPDRKIYAYWEHYMPGPLNIHLDAIKEQEDFSKVRDRILDASAWTAWNQSSTMTPEGMTGHMVKSIAEMHEDAGVSVIPGSKMVQDDVKIQAYLKHWDEAALEAGGQPTFLIMDNCTAMIEELPGIRWKKLSYVAQQEGQISEKLVDANNHAFDDCANALLHLEDPTIEPVEYTMTAEEVRRQYRLQISQGAIEDAIEEAEAFHQDYGDELYDDGLD